MLVWIERLGRIGEDELFGFGLSPEAVVGEALLTPLGQTTICKKNPAMSDSQTLVVASRLDEWIRELGYCQLSCIAAPQYFHAEDIPVKKWRPRELDLRPLNLPNYKEKHVRRPEDEWVTALEWG